MAWYCLHLLGLLRELVLGIRNPLRGLRHLILESRSGPVPLLLRAAFAEPAAVSVLLREPVQLRRRLVRQPHARMDLRHRLVLRIQ